MSENPIPPDAAAITNGCGEQIKQQLDELLDLFRRRLLDDKAKNALIDDLRRQIEPATQAPMFRELLHIVDRSSDPDNDLAASLGEEIVAVLGRHGVTAIPTDGAFDPKLHRVVEARVTEDLPPGRIIKVIRPGYRIDSLVLRPAMVVVSDQGVDLDV